MKRKKSAFIIVFLLLLISAGIYFYYGFVFKEARNIGSEIPDFTITASNLGKDYESNPQIADSLYLNKTIEITGMITKNTDYEVILENTIFCLFMQKTKMKFINEKVTVKGKCIGYDELFKEVKLDQCIIIKHNN